MLWHYTTRQSAESIIEWGEIRQATLYLFSGERPAVWFSADQTFEATATKGGLNRADTHKCFGLVRFGVLPETAPHDFRAFSELSGYPPSRLGRMKRAGAQMGASHYDWFVSFDPVPREAWQRIEQWDGQRWLDYSTDSQCYIPATNGLISGDAVRRRLCSA